MRHCRKTLLPFSRTLANFSCFLIFAIHGFLSQIFQCLLQSVPWKQNGCMEISRQYLRKRFLEDRSPTCYSHIFFNKWRNVGKCCSLHHDFPSFNSAAARSGNVQYCVSFKGNTTRQLQPKCRRFGMHPMVRPILDSIFVFFCFFHQ